MKTLGLYFHIPFCGRKCAYCDFYSVRPQEAWLDEYTRALCASIRGWSEQAEDYRVDTVYFGGGTPVLLGAERLNRVLEEAGRYFSISSEAEITVEANPGEVTKEMLASLKAGGYHRLSLGLQTAVPEELEALGRRHSPEDAAKAMDWARAVGFDNLSLDLMLAIPGQTTESLSRSVEFCYGLGADHISSYLLKVEEGTMLHRRMREGKFVPAEEEAQREFYLQACRELEAKGWRQYEISNFSRPGKESRHNLRYWDDREYLGIGAAAHSFFQGERFYYPRDFRAFVAGNVPEPDGTGGDPEEYVMLRLRLTEGVTEQGYRARFGKEIPLGYRKNAQKYHRAGLLVCDEGGIRLTREGFLVSNELIGEILYG